MADSLVAQRTVYDAVKACGGVAAVADSLVAQRTVYDAFKACGGVAAVADSLVAQLTVYDAVKACGGLAAVDISKAMLQYVRGSNARYKDVLECKRKTAAEEIERAAQKERAKTLIVLKPKKSNLHRRLLWYGL